MPVQTRSETKILDATPQLFYPVRKFQNGMKKVHTGMMIAVILYQFTNIRGI